MRVIGARKCYERDWRRWLTATGLASKGPLAIGGRQARDRAAEPILLRGLRHLVLQHPCGDQIERSHGVDSHPIKPLRGRKRPHYARTALAEMTQRQKQKFEFRGAQRCPGVRDKRRLGVDDPANRLSRRLLPLRSPPSQEEASLLLVLPQGVNPSATETERKSALRVHFDDEYVGQNVKNRDGIDLRSIRRRPFSLQSPPIVVKISGDRQSHCNPPDARAPPPRIGTLSRLAFQLFPTLAAIVPSERQLPGWRGDQRPGPSTYKKNSSNNKMNFTEAISIDPLGAHESVLALAARRFRSGRSPTPVALD